MRSRRCAKSSDSRSTCDVSTLMAGAYRAGWSIFSCISVELDKPPFITQSEDRDGLRIQVHPDAREELLEFLRRVECEAHADGDGAVIVEVPDALGDEQARLEIDLYLKAWQASHPDVEAHLI